MSNLYNLRKNSELNEVNSLPSKRKRHGPVQHQSLPENNAENTAPISDFRDLQIQPHPRMNFEVFAPIMASSSASSLSMLHSSTSSSGSSLSSIEIKDEKPIKSSKRRLINSSDCGENLPRDTSIIPFKLPDCKPVKREDLDDSSDEEDQDPLPIPMVVSECISYKKDIASPSDSTVYEVERLLLCQLRQNVLYYLIKWKGYGLDELTWQKKCDLSCDIVLKQFDERVAICKTVFSLLGDTEKYPGFYDHYVKGIITPSFIEQNLFETTMANFMLENHFAPLFMENWTRICGVLPTNFTWIGESVFSFNAKGYIEKCDAEIPACKCQCEVCLPLSCPCLKAKITAKGLIRSEFANYINECHKDCGCNKKCPSKIYRRGRTFPIMLFKTPKCGWSVRTLVNIPRRRFVMEYVGLIKLHEECRDIKDQTYLFNCDLPDGSIKYVVDATEYGNESRFVNHSCEGNMEAFSVIGYHSSSKITRIIFCSNRDILAGEELTFSYWRTESEYSNINPGEKRLCHCGAEKCRKYLL
uniref:Histone-lysine N-methyltransferase n=1 Tax=Panagrolaimus sp. PS1159 TaxID=55785 RepID=A0AC35FJA0_9BILA